MELVKAYEKYQMKMIPDIKKDRFGNVIVKDSTG